MNNKIVDITGVVKFDEVFECISIEGKCPTTGLTDLFLLGRRLNSYIASGKTIRLKIEEIKNVQ